MTIENKTVIDTIPNNTIGIYGIKSALRDKWYIGQSRNVRKRLKEHLSLLGKKKHRNSHLQSHFNKYGESDLQVRLFIRCDENMLNFYETRFIVGYGAYKNGFNQTKYGDCGTNRVEVYAETDGNLMMPKEFLEICAANQGETFAKAEADLLKTNWEKILIDEREVHNNHSFKKVKDPYGNVLFFNIYESFCKRYKLSLVLLKELIEGKRNFYNKWVRYNDDLSNYDTDQTIKLIDPEGVVVLSPKLKWLEKHLGIRKHHLQAVWLGSSHGYLGWRAYKKELEGIKATDQEKLPTIYKFVSPDLQIHETSNLRAFAKENGLESKNLDSVWRGKRISTSGWRRYKEGVIYDSGVRKKRKIIDPNGNIIVTDNVAQLARDKGVSKNILRNVLRGKILMSPTGWRAFDESLVGVKFQPKSICPSLTQ